MQTTSKENMTYIDNKSYFSIFVQNYRYMEKKEKQERTVVHLEMNEVHWYFGSLAAIYQLFDKEDIGISYGSLKNYGLSPEKPYKNKLCVIRKGILHTIPKKV